MDEEIIIGIDFGASHCSAAVYNGDTVDVIKNEYGNRYIDSCVVLGETDIITGTSEINNNDSGCLVKAVKRLMGVNSGDRDDVFESCEYEVIDEDGNPIIQVPFNGEMKTFTPEEITTMILTKMKSLCETKLKKPISKAVITVPNHFNNIQRQATMEAARITGLEVLKILNDTSATALTYRVQSCKDTNPRNILIYDFGGGSFDVSIVHLKYNVIFVEASNGDSHLGGHDLDTLLMDYFIDEFRRKHLQDLRTNKKSLQQLRIICEKLKKKLSDSQYSEFDLDLMHEGIQYRSGMSRNKFEELTQDIFGKTMNFVRKTLRDADLKKEDIQEVLLVGRCTNIPKVKEMLGDYFTHLKCNFIPEETVVSGAAIQAALLASSPPKEIESLLLIDVNTFSLSVKTDEGNVRQILPKNSYIPTRRWFSYPLTEDNKNDTKMYAIYEENGENEKYLLDIFKVTPRETESEANEIEIALEYDINGILKVTSTQIDLNTNSTINLPIVLQNDHRKQKDEERRAMKAEIQQLVREEIKEFENENYLKSYSQNIKYSIDTFRKLSDEDKFELKIKSEEIERFLKNQVNSGVQLKMKEKQLCHLCEIALKFIKNEEERYME